MEPIPARLLSLNIGKTTLTAKKQAGTPSLFMNISTLMFKQFVALESIIRKKQKKKKRGWKI